MSLIDAGALAAGTLLPSERELANTLKVARNVVRGAYEQLMDAGKLASEGRKGRSVKLWERVASSEEEVHWQELPRAKRARSKFSIFALSDSPFLIPRLLTRTDLLTGQSGFLCRAR